MNILIISPGYPDKYKVHYPFVRQLVEELARQGHHCYVVAPYSISKNKRFYPLVETDGLVTIYRPNYLSFSKYRIGKFCLSDYFRRKAFLRATRMLPQKPDVVYCHFWECAVDGYPYARKHLIPLFVASGESSIASIINPEEISQDVRDYVSGVICVSTKNKEESISLGLTTEKKCVVIPNAVNNKIFRKLDKLECRKKLSVSKDDFVICFVGSFIQRKGPNRVSEAIKMISGEPIKSFFIGKGSLVPECDNILYKGALPHEDIPTYLNASDIFVLPTLAEGCCNAIVEAMACGLPIISSNRSFNRDVLSDSNSIMIEPEKVQEIAYAIKELRDNPAKRIALSEGALDTAKKLTIEHRAQNILSFIKYSVKKQ